MKRKEMLINWRVRILFIFMWTGFILQGISASTGGQPVPLKGEWDGNGRSISPAIPITASITENLLSIQSSSNRSDITIRISNNEVVVYEKTIPAAETAYITIDLDGEAAGLYHLELSNPWDDYLQGEFNL